MHVQKEKASAFSILERIDVGETNEPPGLVAHRPAFSILERIDVGETCCCRQLYPGAQSLSVSSNGSTWVKPQHVRVHPPVIQLSVSSNGSTWVKRVNPDLYNILNLA